MRPDVLDKIIQVTEDRRLADIRAHALEPVIDSLLIVMLSPEERAAAEKGSLVRFAEVSLEPDGAVEVESLD
jgi:hypothetical protein